MVYVFITVYVAMLLVELIGDKMLLTVSALCMRFPSHWVYAGISLAFMGKMLIAVAFGSLIGSAPRRLVAAVSAITFFATAILMWRERPEAHRCSRSYTTSSALLGAFSAVFFSEWADVGQITAAALAAQYRLPLLVWGAATLALMTKGALAIGVAAGVRKCIPATHVRLVAVGIALVMGLLSARTFLLVRH